MKINSKFFRRYYIYIAGFLLSIAFTRITAVLAINYPMLRFYDKWLLIFAVLLIFFDYLIKPYKIKLFSSFKYLLPFVGYMFFHKIIISSSISTYFYGPVVIQLFFMSLLFLNLPKNKDELITTIKILWFSLAVLFMCYFYYLTSMSISDFGLKRLQVEDYGMEININTLSFFAIIWAILALYLKELSIKNQANKFSIMVFVNFLLAIAICSFHASRAALFLAIVLFAYYIYTHYKNKLSHNFSILIVIILFSYLFTTVDWSFLYVIERFKSTDDGFRIKTASDAIQSFMQNPLFGSSGKVLIDTSGSAQHTFYINFITIYGLLGVLFFIPLVKMMISTGLKKSTPSQNMAKIFFLAVWLTAPSSYCQVIALIIILSSSMFSINQYKT